MLKQIYNILATEMLLSYRHLRLFFGPELGVEAVNSKMLVTNEEKQCFRNSCNKKNISGVTV